MSKTIKPQKRKKKITPVFQLLYILLWLNKFFFFFCEIYNFGVFFQNSMVFRNGWDQRMEIILPDNFFSQEISVAGIEYIKKKVIE